MLNNKINLLKKVKFSSCFWLSINLIEKPVVFFILTVKQPSASVKPVTQLGDKLGSLSLFGISLLFELLLEIVLFILLKLQFFGKQLTII